MLTPQEVSEHAFNKASFGGYNMGQVDDFLDTLTEDYSALYKENAGLKSRMKVLVDKVEEYRATEDAMRQTLLSAKRMADSMVKEAEEARNNAVAVAQKEAYDQIAELRQEVRNEEARLEAARSATAAYVTRLRSLHAQELEYLSSLDELSAPASEEEKVDRAVQEIEENLDRIMEEEDAAKAQEAAAEPQEDLEPTRKIDFAPTEEPAAEDPAASAISAFDVPLDDAPADFSSKIDFENLKFGKNFDLDL